MNDDMTRILQPATKPAPLVRAAVTAILLASASALHASDLAGAGETIGDTGSDAADTVSEEVVVTGTRQGGLTIAESPAPIQLVSSEALQSAGKPDLISSLASVVPSFTAQGFGGDMANQTLQARIRGLSPNHVLVLVDGKRRHTTANLAVLGGAYQGGAGVDLNFLPVAAIDHIEVLTDGAAAQYGSDAIAGVINVITRKKSSGGSVSANMGGYFDGGGATGGAGGTIGFDLGGNGYLDLTVEARNHGHSDRGGIDPRTINDVGTYPDSNMALIAGYPYLNHIQGDAEYHSQLAQYSAGYKVSDALEFYSVGTYGKKDAQSFENYRLPSRIQYTPAGGATTYLYPFGFNPKEATQETDYSLTAGAKGLVAGWSWDLGASYGQDKVPMYTLHSGNRNLYAQNGSTPTDFTDGGLGASQSAITFDLSRDIDVGMAGPLNVAFGAETRHDIYKVWAGEPASYLLGGAQSFPGFAPTDAGSHGRTNYAGYADVVMVPVTGLRLDIAGRYEHFSDFGNTTIGKFTGRYDFNPMFALRGTVSTGFRAPTLAEEYYSATNVGPGTAFVQLPPNSPAAALLGLGAGLKPEKSTDYSLGVVIRPAGDLSITLDVFQITVKDRIVGSGTLYGTIGGTVFSQEIVDAIAAAGNQLDNVETTGINIFTNGINTRTRGADLVLGLPTRFGWGKIDWSLGATYNTTEITDVLNPTLGGQPLFDKAALSDIETASPKYVVNLGALLTVGALSVNLRESLYGKSSEQQSDFGDVDGTLHWYTAEVSPKAITNLDIAYQVSDGLRLSIGADNLFNTYPDKVPKALLDAYFIGDDNSAVAQYPSFSPIGINGGYYYAKASYSF